MKSLRVLTPGITDKGDFTLQDVSCWISRLKSTNIGVMFILHFPSGRLTLKRSLTVEPSKRVLSSFCISPVYLNLPEIEKCLAQKPVQTSDTSSKLVTGQFQYNKQVSRWPVPSRTIGRENNLVKSRAARSVLFRCRVEEKAFSQVGFRVISPV